MRFSLKKVVESAMSTYSADSTRLFERFFPCCLGVLYLFFLSISFSYAGTPANYQIIGVQGDVLLNVQRRLGELYQDKSIENESKSTLEAQIEQAMYPFGYFNPHIELVFHPLQITIQPGPQQRITTMKVSVVGEGVHNPVIQKTLQDLPLKQGDPYNNTLYDDAKDKLLSAAHGQGYLKAWLETSEIVIDKEQGTAHIILVLATGSLYHFGAVHFAPTYLSPKLLKRYVPFQYGQPYSSEQLATLNTNLAASGYFNRIDIKSLDDNEQYVPIDLDLTTGDRTSYSLGAGYGTDTGVRGLASLYVVPVNRLGHKFKAVAQGSFQENALQAQYIIPGKNPVIDNYSISGGLTNLDYDTGHSNAALLSFGQQHVLKNYQRILSINALYEDYNYTFDMLHSMSKMVFYPKASLRWNQTNDTLFSPSGYNVNLNAIASSSAMLSQVSMAQVVVDGKAAITFEPIRTRLYVHGLLGGTAVNNVYNVPLSLAQLLGGSDNLKGYSFNSIGPGKIMTYCGVEVQKETIKKWFLIGFFDSGDVYKPDVGSPKYDAGLALMWVSPVGPIKAGLAQPVNQYLQRKDDYSPRLFINMGAEL